MTSEISIRPARHGEEAALTALCLRSKEHWGYDEDFMARAAAELRVERSLIDSGKVLVATDARDRLLGVAALGKTEEAAAADLLLFFIEPDHFGKGVGRRLFAEISALARQQGNRRLVIEADPQAAVFYEKMGARRIGSAPSQSIPGRLLPLLELTL